MAKTHGHLSVGEAALKGALAGALGGAAMLAAEALATRRVLSRGGSSPDEWGRVAAAVGRHAAGVRVRGRSRTAAGVGLHLAYSALAGALYGVARSRGDLSNAAQSLLESGLEYVGFRAERGFMPRRGRARFARYGVKRGVLPLDAESIFAMATSRAFKALTE